MNPRHTFNPGADIAREPPPPTRWKLRTSNSGRFHHYITSGGLRQHRRTFADDHADRRFLRCILTAVVLILVWVVFYILPPC